MANYHLGQVETPLQWGEYFAQHCHIARAWLAGKSVLDPTCASGNLLESLVVTAIKMGFSIDQLPLHNLYGVECDGEKLAQLYAKFDTKFGIKFPQNNIIHGDFITDTIPFCCDILYGNPPWVNFNELPMEYKQILKPFYHQYSLVKNKNEVTMGGSGQDLSCLIIQKAILDHLKPKGMAYFFAPLALLLNDGAHRNFRQFAHGKQAFALTNLYDFSRHRAFKGVKTRYGFMVFARDQAQTFPINSNFYTPNGKKGEFVWKMRQLQPLLNHDDAFQYIDTDERHLLNDINITIHANNMPRQGVNTAGANDVFIFDSYKNINDSMAMVSNKLVAPTILPKQYLFPLINAGDFGASKKDSLRKWVLIPYHANGKPLKPNEIQMHGELWQFLNNYKNILQNRRGLMINAYIQKGVWWALLGVGDYNFKSYKIIWQSYGKREFDPQIFDGHFQANQSLQCFMAFNDRPTAEFILQQLNAPMVKKYFKNFAMDGTMGFAQPGKLKKILNIIKEKP